VLLEPAARLVLPERPAVSNRANSLQYVRNRRRALEPMKS
jgi:hypothetical protein